jgi:hypothetical protein
MYFENFSNFYYDFIRPDGTVDYIILKDITQNVRFKVEVLQNISLYEFYDMQDTDTPELISERFYGTAKYHWVIMIVNQKYDYIEDFVLPINILENRIKEKYGIDNVYDIHHYEYNGWIVDNTSYPEALSVSNYDYEMKLNESKRRIRIISPSLLTQVMTEFRALM